MDARINQLNNNKRHSSHTHTSAVVIYSLLTLQPASSLIPPTETFSFSPTNIISTMISAGPQIPQITSTTSTTSTTIETLPTINSGGNSSGPIVQESDRIPIIIVTSIFVTLLFLSLLFVYIRKKRKESQQKALASAIVAAEAGESPPRSRSILRDSPSPPPPPPPPPPTPTPLPHEIINDDDKPPPRYKISTLQIEPMTRRLTVNLSQKGKSILVNEDRRPNQFRSGSEITEGVMNFDEDLQEVINVTTLRDDDDDESSIEEGDSRGKSFSRRFSARKNFWK
ncbi:hypothetical protein RclHR1_03490001 [Rhizophagus clarus]|uniref:Uncharacterized protein n=1 Tax=Rhizophagus clarus TaxID=94130 RepID=A0A2Z6RQG7_9GLOM|nr:hypothetical protein RclHR1_03490001 [Rhizophagus clarus]GES89820.1 hypothetical protein GLOIN_2v1610485 [Rhizophagus clarus]